MPLPNFDGIEDTPNDVTTQKDLEQILRAEWISCVRQNQEELTGRCSSYVPGPRLDGGVDGKGARFTPIWGRLASFLLANKIDRPDDFIKAQFHNCKDRAPLSPAMIMTDSAINKYKKYNHKSVTFATLSTSYKVQKEAFLAALETATKRYGQGVNAALATLLDNNISVGPLLRYCTAQMWLTSNYNESMECIANGLKKAAVAEYLSAPDIIEQLLDIPASLRVYRGR